MSLSLQVPQPTLRTLHGSGKPIVIAIVNNMPDPALQATERQFRELLSSAMGDRPVCVKFFSLPGISRGRLGRLHVSKHHTEIEQLWQSSFDGLIVTGTEPLARALRDEPYWSDLQELADWAEQNTVSTIWSCLAAHAAVDHLDGIERCTLGGKLFGVFECVRSSDHLLLDGLASRWHVPHSRCNGLSEDALASCDYKVLARSREAGIDIFIKKRKSLFLFMQGHLEYDPGALLREYRRDVARFLNGDRDSYPEAPLGYFPDDTTYTLLSFRERALRERDVTTVASFPITEAKRKLIGPWRAPAVQLYSNWLSYLAEHRSGKIEASESGRFAHLCPTQTTAHG
jgi:homoserine O-succinyltransferase/O-acetyltransferase